jgi:hypothetical protein
MELIAIDALLTLVADHHTLGRDAWVDATLVAASLAEAQERPLGESLAPALETAGWAIEGSSQQSVPLSMLATLLRADPGLAALLERRGSATPEAANAVMDAWWQGSLAAARGDELVVLVATLSNDQHLRPCAQLHALSVPAPSWRWLARSQSVSTRVQRLTMRLDTARHEALGATLAERARPLRPRVKSVAIGD